MKFLKKVTQADVECHNMATAMSRGIVVLDENLLSLKVELEKRNIRVLVPEAGWSDETIKERLLPERIFITNKAKDFEKDISSYEFGLVDVPQSLMSDPKKASKLISDAIIENKLWSLKKGFLMRFKPDGSTELSLVTD